MADVKLNHLGRFPRAGLNSRRFGGERGERLRGRSILVLECILYPDDDVLDLTPARSALGVSLPQQRVPSVDLPWPWASTDEGDISGVKRSQVQVTATTSGLELSPAELIRTALSVTLTMSLLNVDDRDGLALGREANAM
jgi:hypothetical protein